MSITHLSKPRRAVEYIRHSAGKTITVGGRVSLILRMPIVAVAPSGIQDMILVCDGWMDTWGVTMEDKVEIEGVRIGWLKGFEVGQSYETHYTLRVAVDERAIDEMADMAVMLDGLGALENDSKPFTIHQL